jgi:hypothetical protein
MFLNEASNSPRVAYEAYLDRLSEAAEGSGSGSGSLGEAAGEAAGEALGEALGEEEFYSLLAWLDELSMREIEGRLSSVDVERMHELQAHLMVEPADAPEPLDHLELEVSAGRNTDGQISRPASSRLSGARRRRDLWRQLRREDRSTGE